MIRLARVMGQASDGVKLLLAGKDSACAEQAEALKGFEEPARAWAVRA